MKRRRITVWLAVMLIAPFAGAQVLTGNPLSDWYKDLIHACNSNAGVDTDGTTTQLCDGAGHSLPWYMGDDTLDEATGNEYAVKIIWEVDKLTSGETTGILFEITPTSSPEIDYFMQGFNDSLRSFYVRETGEGYFAGLLQANGVLNTSGDWYLKTDDGMFLASDNRIFVSDTTSWNGTAVLDLGLFDSGSEEYWCFGDGDASGCDGYLVADRIMLGGTSGLTLTKSGNYIVSSVGLQASATRANEMYTNTISSNTGTTIRVGADNYNSADNAVEMATGTFTNSTGEAVGVLIKPTMSTTGTATAVGAMTAVLGSPKGNAANRIHSFRAGGETAAAEKAGVDLNGGITSAAGALAADAAVTEAADGKLSTYTWKGTIDFGDLSAAALTKDITVVTLPAKAILQYAILTIAVVPVGVTTFTQSLDNDGAAGQQVLVTTADQIGGAINTVFGDADAERGTDLPDADMMGAKLYSYTATQAITMRATSTVENLDQLSAGQWNVTLVYSVLP